MKAMPTVQKFMTTTPYTIGFDQTLAKAEGFMREHQIRHLPVLKGGKLIGVLTDRDVKLVQSLSGTDSEVVTVEDACSLDPYITAPSAPIDQVCQYMADKKYGCALIEDNKKLVGVFTWVDALHALSELLKQRYHT